MAIFRESSRTIFLELAGWYQGRSGCLDTERMPTSLLDHWLRLWFETRSIWSMNGLMPNIWLPKRCLSFSSRLAASKLHYQDVICSQINGDCKNTSISPTEHRESLVRIVHNQAAWSRMNTLAFVGYVPTPSTEKIETLDGD